MLKILGVVSKQKNERKTATNLDVGMATTNSIHFPTASASLLLLLQAT